MFERNAAQVAFYHSGAWKRTRAAFLDSRHHICERCGRPATVVHHRHYIDATNVDDPDVTLSWDNLECLCVPCHEREHHADGTEYRVTREGLSFDLRGRLVCDASLKTEHR